MFGVLPSTDSTTRGATWPVSHSFAPTTAVLPPFRSLPHRLGESRDPEELPALSVVGNLLANSMSLMPFRWLLSGPLCDISGALKPLPVRTLPYPVDNTFMRARQRFGLRFSFLSSLWGVVWRRGTPMMRGAGGAR